MYWPGPYPLYFSLLCARVLTRSCAACICLFILNCAVVSIIENESEKGKRRTPRFTIEKAAVRAERNSRYEAEKTLAGTVRERGFFR